MPPRNSDAPILPRECAAMQKECRDRLYNRIYGVGGALLAAGAIACAFFWNRTEAHEERIRAQEIHGVQVQSDVRYIREAVDDIRTEQKRRR
jgi:hypothetical protein